MKLLGVSNTKTMKGEARGYLTAIIALMRAAEDKADAEYRAAVEFLARGDYT